MALTANCKMNPKFKELLKLCGILGADAQCFGCSSLKFASGQASKGDFVLIASDSAAWDGGQIFYNFLVSGLVYTLVSTLHLTAYNHGAAAWSESGGQAVLPGSQLLAVVTYTEAERGFVTLILFHLQ